MNPTKAITQTEVILWVIPKQPARSLYHFTQLLPGAANDWDALSRFQQTIQATTATDPILVHEQFLEKHSFKDYPPNHS